MIFNDALLNVFVNECLELISVIFIADKFWSIINVYNL